MQAVWVEGDGGTGDRCVLHHGDAGGTQDFTRGLSIDPDSSGGLLDESDPVVEWQIRDLLNREVAARGLLYHHLRHRHSGRKHGVELHLVFEDSLTVGEAHVAATEIEARDLSVAG